MPIPGCERSIFLWLPSSNFTFQLWSTSENLYYNWSWSWTQMVASLSQFPQQWQLHSWDQSAVLLSIQRQEINSQRNLHKETYIGRKVDQALIPVALKIEGKNKTKKQHKTTTSNVNSFTSTCLKLWTARKRGASQPRRAFNECYITRILYFTFVGHL